MPHISPPNNLMISFQGSTTSNDNLSMSLGLIDKLVNGCYMTILSLSLGIIYKLSLNHGTIHNLVIEP
ncbi:hypothetical protein PILCRDRAFT_16680 [Piloderma croceum F 1598]|uniref:Uncharacterized protein n=1 Tax=Piloderma croceum (strain F 1598) TaxID=765440 RepID=A0A0C3EUX3_PILCF|nr:hypothetical protein PILCRDRAFT_16680 [Piloderma croceum F 1598]